MASQKSLTAALRSVACIAAGFAWLAGLTHPLNGSAAETPVVQATPPPDGDSPENQYQALLELSKVPGAPNLVASYDINNRLHEGGIAFLTKFPTHPLRWDVVALIARAVYFTREEVDTNGRKQVVRDIEQQRKWHDEYWQMTTELLAAPDASADARQKTLAYRIVQYAYRVAEKRAPNPAENAAMIRNHLDELEKYPPTHLLISSYRDYAKTLEVVDPVACSRFLRDLSQRYVSGASFDRQVRDFATGHLRLMDVQATPAWDQLASVEPRLALTNQLRGKVVLIGVGGGASYTNLLAGIYDKFRGQGFEIIEISGIPSPARKAAIEALPWRVVQGDGLIGKFAAKFGINSFPSWFIVARDGTFVTDVTTQTLARMVERELSLAESK